MDVQQAEIERLKIENAELLNLASGWRNEAIDKKQQIEALKIRENLHNENMIELCHKNQLFYDRLRELGYEKVQTLSGGLECLEEKIANQRTLIKRLIEAIQKIAEQDLDSQPAFCYCPECSKQRKDNMNIVKGDKEC